jgi:DNA-3-methyladenine glycosylase II
MSTNKITPAEYLKKQDRRLCRIIDFFGTSHFATEERKPFDALSKAVISQQLSNAASNSITNRIISIHGKRPFNPNKFLSLEDEALRGCGISYSKIKTIKGIAEACIRKEISAKAFESLDDKQALQKLTSYWGIGNWTAEIFMMFFLKRLDILPLGDAGLQRAHALLYPNAKSLEITSEKWRPYRAVAAGYLWQFLDNPACHLEVLKAK